MFVIDRYAYNNRWTAVPELHKFSLYIFLWFPPLTNSTNCYHGPLDVLYC